MGLDAVRQYLSLLWRRYQRLRRREDKSVVLDEIVRNLCIHRKSATRLMCSRTEPKQGRGAAPRRRRYSEWAEEHLKRLWRKMGYLGSVRLKAALPDWLPYYDECDATVKGELVAMSARTIERLLRAEKAALRRRFNTGTRRGKTLVTTVPLRNFDRRPETPVHIESDAVCHCGDSLSGSFVRSVTAVDLVVGWTEVDAIEKVNGVAVRTALEAMEKRFPVAFKGLYFDNGCEFINHDVVEVFAKRDGRDIPVRRGRPYRKNDQALVEQKNFTHVRQAFGYDRITGRVTVGMMNAIYRSEWRLLQNFFWPQSRLAEKERVGSRIVRRIESPKTPYQRILEHPDVAPDVKARLTAQRAALDPFLLRRRLAENSKNSADT